MKYLGLLISFFFVCGLWPMKSYAKQTDFSCVIETQQYVFCMNGTLNIWKRLSRKEPVMIAFADKKTISKGYGGDINHIRCDESDLVRNSASLTKTHFTVDATYFSNTAGGGEALSFQYDRINNRGSGVLRLSMRYNEPPVNLKIKKMECAVPGYLWCPLYERE